ncbi:hypothetical protein ACFWD7_06245 [Streptomyces mirabilis]|uniref:hypothetical protein n=1 Tax=Streptomyces mirabilis TaxID=68239 RepID=UPI003675FE49
MSRYLEEAANQLRKASAATEQRYAGALHPYLGNESRQQIAQGFAALAAIDKGLLPAEITQDVIAAIVSRTTA